MGGKVSKNSKIGETADPFEEQEVDVLVPDSGITSRSTEFTDGSSGLCCFSHYLSSKSMAGETCAGKFSLRNQSRIAIVLGYALLTNPPAATSIFVLQREVMPINNLKGVHPCQRILNASGSPCYDFPLFRPQCLDGIQVGRPVGGQNPGQ